MAETIVDLSGNVILADEFRSTGGAGGSPATEAFVLAETKSKTETVALTSLTGTVGTANDAMTALAAVPAAVAAATGADTATLPTLVSVNATITALNAVITALNNNLADLQAKQNAVIAALKA